MRFLRIPFKRDSTHGSYGHSCDKKSLEDEISRSSGIVLGERVVTGALPYFVLLLNHLIWRLTGHLSGYRHR